MSILLIKHQGNPIMEPNLCPVRALKTRHCLRAEKSKLCCMQESLFSSPWKGKVRQIYCRVWLSLRPVTDSIVMLHSLLPAFSISRLLSTSICIWSYACHFIIANQWLRDRIETKRCGNATVSLKVCTQNCPQTELN